MSGITSFSEFLISEAIEWQQSLFRHIAVDPYEGNVMVPLTNALLKRHFDVSSKRAAHVAALKQIYQLDAIKGKKSKHISATTSFGEELITSGIWGGSGAVYIIRGDFMAIGDRDIMSMPTKQGVRLVPLSYLLSFKEESKAIRFEEFFYKEMVKNLRESAEDFAAGHILSDVKPSSDSFQEIQRLSIRLFEWSLENSENDRIFRKIQNTFIRKYMDFWNERFSKNKFFDWKEVIFTSRGMAKNASYNEVVVSNFQIEKVIYSSDIDFDEWIGTEEKARNRFPGIVFEHVPKDKMTAASKKELAKS